MLNNYVTAINDNESQIILQRASVDVEYMDAPPLQDYLLKPDLLWPWKFKSVHLNLGIYLGIPLYVILSKFIKPLKMQQPSWHRLHKFTIKTAYLWSQLHHKPHQITRIGFEILC